MISINYNPSVLRAQNNLNKANNAMGVALQRMSTGYKINSAADDAAGLYIATGLNTQIRGLKQAQKNVADGINILSIAEGSLNNMGDMLNRVRDLALQGANSYYSKDSRNALQNEADKLLEEVTRVKKAANFNGLNLFESDSGASTQTASAASVSAFSPPPRKAASARVASVSTDVIPAGYTAIYSAEDLNNIRNDLSGKYILMNDIDLSAYDNWDPIGAYTEDMSQAFTGIFDGNGHVVKNLKINRFAEVENTNDVSLSIGLFGYADQATIKNVGLENVDITGNLAIGGIAGGMAGGTISDCYVTGKISCIRGYDGGSDMPDSLVGGIVGAGFIDTNSNATTITNCCSTCNITSDAGMIGGIVGVSYGDVSNCYSTGDIRGIFQVGGLIGITLNQIKISNCYTTGNVSGEGGIGGLIGGTVTTIEISNCYTTGNITGDQYVGGLSGVGVGQCSNCYVAGNVKGNDISGLIFGRIDEGTLTNVWADKKESNLNMFGEIGSNTTVTNSEAVEHSRFTSAEFWKSQNLDKSVWDLSTVPPTLKNMPAAPDTPDTPDPTPSGGTAGGNIRLQVGANADSDANAIYVDITFDLKNLAVDFSDPDSCTEAVKTVDKFLKEINDKLSYIGATQNRLESVAQSQVTQIENFTAAKSTIMDADIAEESAEFTKQQILTQTSSALLVQANSLNANAAMSLINSLR